MCEICKDVSEKRLAIEKQLVLGNISLKAAADELDVNEKTLWHHVRYHLPTRYDTLADKDIQTQLKKLLAKLHELVDSLLALPATTYTRQLPGLLRELRELITILGRSRGEVPPEVQIQVNILNKYTTWMMENLCPQCKLKAASKIEEWEKLEAVKGSES